MIDKREDTEDSDWDSIVEYSPLKAVKIEDVSEDVRRTFAKNERNYVVTGDMSNEEFEQNQEHNKLSIEGGNSPKPPSSPMPQLKHSALTSSARSANATDFSIQQFDANASPLPMIKIDLNCNEDKKFVAATKSMGADEPVWKFQGNEGVSAYGRDSAKFTTRSLPFDHGKLDRYEICEESPESCIQKPVKTYTRGIQSFWANLFGFLKYFTDFVIFFVLQFSKLIIRDIAQPLFVGVLTITCDHLLKPLLTTTFNSALQPTFIFLWNVFSSLVRIMEPCMGFIGQWFALLTEFVRAFRLVEYRTQLPSASKGTATV